MVTIKGIGPNAGLGALPGVVPGVGQGITADETFPVATATDNQTSRITDLFSMVGSIAKIPILLSEMAETDKRLPYLRGHLMISDFVERDRGGRCDYVFAPSFGRARSIREFTFRNVRDHFPELAVSSGMPEDKTVEALKPFFASYRRAERSVFGDGAHCDDSARRVNTVLMKKGFDAYVLTVTKVVTGDTVLDAGITKHLKELAQKKGNTTLDSAALLSLLEDGHGGHKIIADRHGEQVHLGEFVTTVQTIDIKIELGEHAITAVRIGGKVYLIDINGQQYGPEYDRLVFIAAEEAAEHGIILRELVETTIANIGSRIEFELGLETPRILDQDQVRIRRAMSMKS